MSIASSTSKRAARTASVAARALPALLATGALCGAAALAPATARAQSTPVAQRFALRLEGGLGSMLPDDQRIRLGLGLGVQGSARLGFNLVDALAVEAAFSSWLFPATGGDGQVYFVGGGLRFEPRIGRVGRIFVDAHAGAGFTGQYTRFMYNVGLGFEFRITDWLALGPVARIGHLLTNDQDYRSDAVFWSAGGSITLRIPEPSAPPPPPPPPPLPPPPPDTDHDGVLDPDDQCPTEPAGDHPDPARRGCPLRDTDGDGVYDPDDRCVNEPAGAHPDPERAGCPDGDDDSDTVLNHDDQCRTEPQGMFPDPARPGCPTPDRDHDTVPDAVDHCPDQPGMPSSDPNRNGCPGLVVIEGGQIRIARPVFFATNRDTVLPRSFPVLRAVAEALRLSLQIHRVAIEGHTDDVGDDTTNMGLSDRRAQSVMRFLLQNHIDASRLEAHGLGETRPVVPIAGLRGRALSSARGQNRRVEFHIVDPAPATGASPATSAAPASPPDLVTPASPPAATTPPPPAPHPATTTPAVVHIRRGRGNAAPGAQVRHTPPTAPPRR